jgi:hypothetical protein
MDGAEKCRWPVNGEIDGREVSDKINENENSVCEYQASLGMLNV